MIHESHEGHDMWRIIKVQGYRRDMRMSITTASYIERNVRVDVETIQKTP